MKTQKFPSAATILLWIFLAVMLASWLIPAITYITVYSEELGREIIDEATVVIGAPSRISPWKIPEILANGVQKVFSTILIICACNGMFSVLNASGVFTVLIKKLCALFRGREVRLIALIYLSFSVLGLVVMPHCFIAFAPIVVAMSIKMGYDAVVGLAMVLLGATTASMTGPFSAVTAVCQESVGLPLYSGMGVRLFLFLIFDVVNVVYLCGYASRIRKNSSLGYRNYDQTEKNFELSSDKEDFHSIRQYIALFGLVAVFVLIALGSTLWNFSTSKIAGIFIAYATVMGFVLGYSFDQTFRHFCAGVRDSVTTSAVLAMVGATTIVLESSGLVSTVQYYSDRAFSVLPGVLIPTGMLVLICLLNCVLPSGPAKGVLLMPLLGPVAQMSGMSLQASVLAYNMGDSFSNYFLPYDATTASYLEATKVPYTVWVRFYGKLFLLWMVVGIGSLTTLYYTGYGPF